MYFQILILMLLIPIYPLVRWTDRYFDQVIDGAVKHQTKQIEEVFLKQNATYLDDNHINFLKLNMNQQLLYSSVDYLSIWTISKGEVIKVGDGGLSKKVEPVFLQDKDSYVISHLDKPYYVGKMLLEMRWNGVECFFLYAFHLSDLEERINVTRQVVLYGYVFINLLCIVMMIVWGWLKRLQEKDNSLTTNERGLQKVLIVRKSLNWLLGDFRNAYGQVDNLLLDKKSMGIEREVMIYRQLYLKSQELLNNINASYLLTTFSNNSEVDVSINHLLFRAFDQVMKQGLPITWDFFKTRMHINMHKTVFIQKDEVFNQLIALISCLKVIYQWSSDFTLVVKDNIGKKMSMQVIVEIQDTCEFENVEEFSDLLKWRLWISEVVLEHLKVDFEYWIIKKMFYVKIAFQAGESIDQIDFADDNGEDVEKIV